LTENLFLTNNSLLRKSTFISVGLLILALVLHYYLDQRTTSYIKYLPDVLAFIASFMLFKSILPNTIMGDPKLKGKIVFILSFLVMIGASIAMDKIKHGSNNEDQITTNSPSVKAWIVSTDHKTEFKYKKKIYPESWLYEYHFDINNNDYKGVYHSTINKYKEGDTITIHYLEVDPSINKLIE
jgi:hypothetical protein